MTDHKGKTRVFFSVTNSICYDQRVLKIAKTVSSLGCDITIIGRITSNCCSPGEIPFKNVRFKMFFKRGFLFYKFFNIRLFLFLLSHKSEILVANDLDTLLPNYLVSKLKQIPLVYDSHEFFTGLPEVQNRSFVRWVWTMIEKMIFPGLKYVITVSEPIASLYEKMYNVKPLVIRNISRNSQHIKPYTHEELGVPVNDLLLIIQGNGINIDKGAEELIDAMNLIDRVTLLVVGAGDVVPNLKFIVNKSGLEHKVIFIPTVPWEKLLRYTKSADIGLCIEKDTNLNYFYSLPNKLFDYISAGIPVVASNLPETGKIIKESGCGIIIDKVDAISISAAISSLNDDRVKLAELTKNALAASEKLNWDMESEKVINLFGGILTKEIWHNDKTSP